jgi:type VI secretion system ImpM family protein
MLPGWYGKLPSLGDFASRRLPPLFIEPWDRWLANSLASWRERDESWMDAYLAAPPLRFALGAGLPFEQSPGYAGVLMPSVDRVGRYFPLTVVRPRANAEMESPAAWLAMLEGVAVTALNDDWDAERLDEEFGRLDVGTGLTLSIEQTGPTWPARGHSLWWCDRGGELSTPVVAAGLPGSVMLVELLTGSA